MKKLIAMAMSALMALSLTGAAFADETEAAGADLSGIKAICIGRQTRAAAQAQGMETRMAEKATLDALLDAVVQCAAEDRKPL